MNFRAVRSLLGRLLQLLALALLAPAALSLSCGELRVAEGFLLSALIASGGGLLLMFRCGGALRTVEGRPAFFQREGLAVVGLAWFLASVVGALPFLLSGVTHSWTKALFESTSGLTTTGATIFSADEVDLLPMGVSFWRALTHWMGGIGIVVVFVVLHPMGARSLFRSEARESAEARVRDTAISLLQVYVGFTAACVVALLLVGVGPFDAVTHAFSTMATGGFSTHGASAAYFDSPAVEAVLIVFMIIAGLNFAIWQTGLAHGPRRGFARAMQSTEVKLYLALLLGSSLFVTLMLWFWGGSNGLPNSDLPDYSSFLRSLRDSTFSVVSIQTCTGYGTADFERWPDAGRLLLMTLAFIGGCGGSTAGGIKVFRLAIILRTAIATVKSFGRPRTVVSVFIDGVALDEPRMSAATRYVVMWILVAIVGAFGLTVCGETITEAVTSAISCLNNVGPGLGGIGPAGDYSHFSSAARLLLSGLMIIGRLEFFAIIALFLPGFWRS